MLTRTARLSCFACLATSTAALVACGGAPGTGGGARTPPPVAVAAPPAPSSPPPADCPHEAAAPASTDDVAALIKRQSQEFSEASATNDVAVLGRYLDDNVVFMNEEGQTATKKDLVSDPTPTPEGAGRLVQTDFAVQVHGSVAVTSFTDNSTQPFHGQTLHASFRSTEVWLKEPDGWKMISSQTIAVADDPPAVTLPVKVLDEYVGSYKAGDDFTLKIARSGNELTGSTGGDPYPIKAELRDVLFTPGQHRVRRLVVRDARGKVTGLVVRREGHDLLLKRVG